MLNCLHSCSNKIINRIFDTVEQKQRLQGPSAQEEQSHSCHTMYITRVISSSTYLYLRKQLFISTYLNLTFSIFKTKKYSVRFSSQRGSSWFVLIFNMNWNCRMFIRSFLLPKHQFRKRLVKNWLKFHQSPWQHKEGCAIIVFLGIKSIACRVYTILDKAINQYVIILYLHKTTLLSTD